MKLKKIASLAMAGALAVSMLAGCGTDANANSGNTNTKPTTSTSIVDAVNNGQDSTNTVKITFTSDADLDKALKTAVDVYGVSAAGDTSKNSKQNLIVTQGNVSKAVASMTGLKSVEPASNWVQYKSDDVKLGGYELGHFLSNDVVRATESATGTSVGSEDGKTYSVYGVVKYSGTSYLTEEAVLNSFANDMNTVISNLGVSSDDTDNDGVLNAGITTGKEYYGYTYDGNVSMTSYTQADGTVAYYVAFVINQHITDKKL